MNNEWLYNWRQPAVWLRRIVWTVGISLWLVPGVKAQQQFETLVVNHEIYSNVTIQSRSATHISFTHSRGFATVKASEVTVPVAKSLGPGPKDNGVKAAATDPVPANLTAEEEPPTRTKTLLTAYQPKVEELNRLWQENVLPNVLPVLMRMMWIIAGIVLGCHLLFSYCSMLICQKAGQQAGVMVWLPVLQVFPLLRAAGMSGWMFLLLCLPMINAIVSIFWCIKICQALKKSAWWALLLLLPVTNILAYLYLAFSGDGSSEDAPPQRSGAIKLDYAPAASGGTSILE